MAVQTIGSKATATFHQVLHYANCNRLNLLFSAAIAFISIPRLYRAFQCFLHTSVLLDDPLKLCRCKMLYKKAKGNPAYLEQCIGLLDSIRAPDGKDAMRLKVVKCYLYKKNPEKAFACAKKLTEPSYLLEAFDLLLKHATSDAYREQLTRMLKKAKAEGKRDDSEYATRFKRLGNDKEANACAHSTFVDAAFLEKSSLEKLKGVCKAAVAYHRIENEKECKECIANVPELLTQVTEEEYFEAHLASAQAYYQMGNDEDMNYHLCLSINAKKNRTTALIHFLESIQKNDTVDASYKKFDIDGLSAEIVKEEYKAAVEKEEDAVAKMQNLISLLQKNPSKDPQHMVHIVQLFEGLNDDQKADFGSRIIVLYNQWGLHTEAKQFLDTTFDNFVKGRADELNWVLNTVSEHAPEEQNESQLLRAEMLLAKMDPSTPGYTMYQARIIEAYQTLVSEVKALMLLYKYENWVGYTYSNVAISVAAIVVGLQDIIFNKAYLR